MSFACFACIEAQKGPNFDIWEMLNNEHRDEPLPPPDAAADEQQRTNAAFRRRRFEQYLWAQMGINPRQPNRPWASQPWD